MSRSVGVALAVATVVAGFGFGFGFRLAFLQDGEAGSVFDVASPAHPLTSAEQLVDDDCDFDPDLSAACAWLWPSRQDAAGDTALPVVVLREGKSHASGIASIYLMGGPGGATSLDPDSIPYWSEWRETLGLDHDLVLYDQRGSFNAWPSTDCPGYLDLMLRQLGEPGDGEAAQTVGWQAYETLLLDCAQRVPAAERRTGLYSTATHRTDLVELMLSLQSKFGYRSFVLYGASYGSRLALETARIAPEGLVGRVVLDAFYTPGIDLDERYPRTLDEMVRDYGDWCASEPVCKDDARAFGPRLLAALDRVAAAPLTKTVDLGEWDPETPSVDLHIDATGLLSLVVYALTFGEHAARLPQALDDITAGRWTPIWDTMAQDSAFAALDGGFSPLAFHLVECRDNAGFDREGYAKMLAAAPRFAALLPYVQAGDGFCERLGVVPAPLPAVATEVDALVVSMQVEPVTPWRAAREGLALLRTAEWRLVRGVGHVVADRDACASRAIGAYMNSGVLDAWRDCDLVESARFEHGRAVEVTDEVEASR